MDIKEIKEWLGDSWDSYRRVFEQTLRTDNVLLSRINAYLMNNGGKQLRPVLSLLTSMACGCINYKSYCCAAVAEILHTATLLHDDVADDGNMRRGVPTVKAVFTPAASVLTGDYWLAKALSILIQTCDRETLGFFSFTMQELSEGELLQMEKADRLDTTEEDYNKIIACKTASLFIATVKSAACSVEADKEKTEAVSLYAYHVGMAFQIRDDILDYSPKLETGKLSGADLKERKITLPLLGAMKNAPSDREGEIRRLIGKIDHSVKGGEISPQEKKIIEEVNSFVRQYQGISYAQQKLEEHSRQAVRALDTLPDSAAKNHMAELARYLATRNN